jgi:hypothetical protein
MKHSQPWQDIGSVIILMAGNAVLSGTSQPGKFLSMQVLDKLSMLRENNLYYTSFKQ